MSLAVMDRARPSDSYPPNYSLDPEEVTRLSTELMQEHGVPEGSGHGVYEVRGTSRYANLGRTVEQVAFNEAFQNDAGVMYREYGPYDTDASLFWEGIDTEAKKTSGTLRVIEHSPAGFKTLNDLKDRKDLKNTAGKPVRITPDTFQAGHGVEDLETVWDIGTVAVPKEYRGPRTGITVALYRGLYASARARGIKHWVSVIDNAEHNNLNALGVPFVPVLDSTVFNYLGSWAKVLYCNVAEIEPAMRAHQQRMLGEAAVASTKRKGMIRYLSTAISSVLDGDRVDPMMRFDFSK